MLYIMSYTDPMTYTGSSISQYIYLDQGKTSWAACATVLRSSGRTLDKYDLNTLEPDIFGEDIVYSGGAPVAHHWNSIISSSVRGTAYGNAFSSSLGTDPTRVNYLTGNNHPLALVSDVGEFMIWSMDTYPLAKDAFQRAQSGSENPICNNWLCVLQKTWIGNNPISSTPDPGFFAYGFSAAITRRRLKNGDGYTYATYAGSIVPYQTSFVPRVYWYRFPTAGATKSYRTWCDFEHEVVWTIRPDEDISTALQRLKNDLEIGLESLSPWIKRLYISGSSFIYPERGGAAYSAPQHPAIERIFPLNSRNRINWPALAGQAYQSLNYTDINGIAYLNDLREMGAAVTSLVQTLKSVPSKRVKAVASAWLSVHYGFKLMFLDTKELHDSLATYALRDARKSKCQAVYSWADDRARYTARYQVFYNEFEKLQSLLLQLLKVSDALITSENIWDMIPWSFVIDWFIGIGDILSGLDGYASAVQEHRVIACGKSIRATTRAIPTMLGLPKWMDTSGVEISLYHRRYSRILQYPSLVPTVTLTPFNHAIEGAALYLSRR